MIGALRGTISQRLDDEIILDVNGVGYLLAVTSSVLELSDAAPVNLIVFTDVKENSISLSGFATARERQVFQLLKKVKGIGSKSAITIVSTLSAEGVLSSIARDDVSALKRVSGVGGKTAERILVELREAVSELVASVPKPLSGRIEKSRDISPRRATSVQGMIAEDAMLALEKLGFPAERARLSVSEVLQESPDGANDAGTLLRLALSRLA